MFQLVNKVDTIEVKKQFIITKLLTYYWFGYPKQIQYIIWTHSDLVKKKI